MLNTTGDITASVHETINEILRDADVDPMEFTGSERLADLGFTSLLLARLIIHLETVFDADPFEEKFVVSDIRTVDELISAYRQTIDGSVAS
ncbi:phosphopantetheine-binding protein [Streptomyces sp. NPDC048297]|uniref:phosphopantetheine-binding protein n=1 Tax=Streptomyces sp. NPDC048297 TaxID=3365531 RepID=UPI003712C50D